MWLFCLFSLLLFDNLLSYNVSLLSSSRDSAGSEGPGRNVSACPGSKILIRFPEHCSGALMSLPEAAVFISSTRAVICSSTQDTRSSPIEGRALTPLNQAQRTNGPKSEDCNPGHSAWPASERDLWLKTHKIIAQGRKKKTGQRPGRFLKGLLLVQRGRKRQHKPQQQAQEEGRPLWGHQGKHFLPLSSYMGSAENKNRWKSKHACVHLKAENHTENQLVLGEGELELCLVKMRLLFTCQG